MRSSLLEDLTGRLRRGTGEGARNKNPATDDDRASRSATRSGRARCTRAACASGRSRRSLSVALVGLAGIWGGAELQKRHGPGRPRCGQQRAGGGLRVEVQATGAGGGGGAAASAAVRAQAAARPRGR